MTEHFRTYQEKLPTVQAIRETDAEGKATGRVIVERRGGDRDVLTEEAFEARYELRDAAPSTSGAAPAPSASTPSSPSQAAEAADAQRTAPEADTVAVQTPEGVKRVSRAAYDALIAQAV